MYSSCQRAMQCWLEQQQKKKNPKQTTKRKPNRNVLVMFVKSSLFAVKYIKNSKLPINHMSLVIFSLQKIKGIKQVYFKLKA